MRNAGPRDLVPSVSFSSAFEFFNTFVFYFQLSSPHDSRTSVSFMVL
jgi:hypothetical protein